jgi:hypothetical protein
MTNWAVSLQRMPRERGDLVNQSVYDTPEAAVARFVSEVALSVMTAAPPAGATGVLASMYQEFVIDRGDTEDCFLRYLMGEPERNVRGVGVLKEVVEIHGSPVLHVLAKIEGEE